MKRYWQHDNMVDEQLDEQRDFVELKLANLIDL